MRTLAAALLAALLAHPSGGAAATFSSQPRVTQTTMTNGLRVVVVENHALPLAQVAMWYRFGSSNDPPGRRGLAHALEHMMFRGTHAMPGPALDLVAAQLGFETNAETDFESTHYYQTVPVENLGVALHIEADRMRGLLLRPRDWSSERRAVIAEIAGYESSDAGALENAVRRTAYGASPFAHDPAGTADDLARTSAADLRRAYDAAYAPDNATLVVTGDVEPTAVFARVRELFSSIRGRSRVIHVPTERLAARGFTVRRKAVSEDVVDVALESQGLLASGAAEEVAVELIQPRHAALRDLLVGAGPCLSYDVDDDSQLRGGLYHVICRVDTEVATPAMAVRAIRRALIHLAAHVPANAITYARRRDLAESAYARDALASEADLFGESIALQQTDPRVFDRDAARVSPAAVTAVLRRWANPVGVGIASGARRYGIREVGSRKTRSETVSPAATNDLPIVPTWARGTPRPPPPVDSSPVDTFAFSNGVRVFVEPRRGNGTVYIRGGFDRMTDLEFWRADDASRFAEPHAMTIELGPQTNMHGYARDLGTMLSVLSDFWRTPFRQTARSRDALRARRPEHAWIVVTGDVDPLAVRALTSRLFGGWQVKGPDADPPSPAPNALPSPGSVMTFGAPAPGAMGMLMQPAPGRDDPDSSAMAILNAILGGDGDFDTRLMRDVRIRRGLVYTVASLYDPRHSAMLIGFEGRSRDLAATRAAIRAVVEGLRTGGISPAERERAVRKLLAKALRQEATPDGILDRLSAAARERRTPDDLETLAARYAAVRLDDLERVARTRLLPDRMIEIDKGAP